MKPDASPATGVTTDLQPNGLLIAIGCDRYETIGALSSAEADAEAIFKELTAGSAALYAPTKSVLLKSPARADVDRSFRAILEDHEHVDVLAFYFAGHGIVVDGSLYLCPVDTSLAAISVTAINISQILRTVCELRPTHAYLIVDACFSGGAALDLSAILRADILERSPGFGLTVLASAHMAKEAAETSVGGLFTTELLKVLRGDYGVNDTRELLGLGEIARNLRLSPLLSDQEPNLWDLNLTGPDTFCRNPTFKAGTSTHTSFGTLRYSYKNAGLSDGVARQLWQKYLDLPAIEVSTLTELFSRVIDELSGQGAIGSISAAIAQSFAEALEVHEDTFAPTLARAAMVRALLEHQSNGDARQAVSSQLSHVFHSASKALKELEINLEGERHHLVGAGALADLYFLPLRIAKILGWIGLLMHATKAVGEDAIPLATLKGLSEGLLKRYGDSLVAVGDDQAAPFLLFLSQCKAFGWSDEAEEVIGRLYHDFNDHRGRILINNPTAENIVEYLLLKESRPLEADHPYIQNPSDLFAVVLVCAAAFDLDDAIDTSLIQLDHTSFAFFVPASYQDYWKPIIDDGLTLVFQLGHGVKTGYGVWTIRDMRRAWRHEITPLIDSAKEQCDEVDLLAAELMSLIAPDRLAWFAMPSISARVTIPR